MSECDKNCDNLTNIVVTGKDLNNDVGNSSQTENAEGENVHKRPRGRPKLAKVSIELSKTLSKSNEDIQHVDKSSSSEGRLRKRVKYDGVYSSNSQCGKERNIVEKRPRGRPRLIKPLPEKPRRGRGRPKGSFNRKKKIAENLSDILKKGSFPRSSEATGTNIDEVCPLTTEGSLQIGNYGLNNQPLTVNAKRRRGRPPGARNKPKTVKLKPMTKTSIHLSKETTNMLRKGKSLRNTCTKSKQLYKATNVRDIPKHRFDEAMTMLNDMEHPVWEERNISCNKSIHRHWDEYVATPSDHNLRLKFARQFLVRRDWINLSKVLSISLQDVVTSYNSYYSLFTKYAAICLAHTDKQQFNKFVQFLLKTEDGGKVLQKCTQFTQNCTDEEEV